MTTLDWVPAKYEFSDVYGSLHFPDNCVFTLTTSNLIPFAVQPHFIHAELTALSDTIFSVHTGVEGKWNAVQINFVM